MSDELARELMADLHPEGAPAEETPAPAPEPVAAKPEPEAKTGKEAKGAKAAKANAPSKPEAAKPEPEVKPEPAPQAAPQPAQETEDGPKKVPLAALIDLRLEARDAKAEAKALKAKLAEYESQAQSLPPFDPNDPEGLARWTQDYVGRSVASAKFDWSEANARERHGNETVDAAMQWGIERSQASAAFAAEYFNQKDPINWIVKQQKREQSLALFGDDPDAYVRKRAAELGLLNPPAANGSINGNGHVPPQPQPGTPPAAQPLPTRSIATMPPAGGNQNTVAIGIEAAMEAFPD